MAKSFGIMAKVGLSNDPALADCFQNFQQMWYVLIDEAQRDTDVDSWKTSILDFSDVEFHYISKTRYDVHTVSKFQILDVSNSEVRKTNL